MWERLMIALGLKKPTPKPSIRQPDVALPQRSGVVPPRPMSAPVPSPADAQWPPRRPLSPTEAYVAAPSVTNTGDNGDSMAHLPAAQQLLIAQQMVFSRSASADLCGEPVTAAPPLCRVYEEPAAPRPSEDSRSRSCGSDDETTSGYGSTTSGNSGD